MITEIFVFKIDPEKDTEFEQMYTGAAPVLRRQPGYQSDRLMRAIERPDEYILAVEWSSVEAHQAFIAAPDYPEMDGPFSGFVKEGLLAHYNTVVSG